MKLSAVTHKWPAVAVPMAAFGLGIALAPTLPAQGGGQPQPVAATRLAAATNTSGPRPSAASQMHVFRGKGTSSPDHTKRPQSAQSAPKMLSAADRAKISLELSKAGYGKFEPSNRYVRLTPSQPNVANRGLLVYTGPGIVHCGDDYAAFFPDVVENYVVIHVWSPANRKYLIDCAVGGTPGNEYANYFVSGPDGTRQRFRPEGSGQLLTFALDATTAGWYVFSISALHMQGWSFFSCEVTNA